MKSISLKVLAFVLFPTVAIAANGRAPESTAGVSSQSAPSGDAAGTAAANPARVNTLARKLPEVTRSMLPEVPSQTYGGSVMVGNVLSGDFTYYPIPDHDPLDYAILDHHRVIVDCETRRIVKVIP